jgi:pullulanase
VFYMTRRCGAWQVGGDATQGAIEFRIFFPPGADPEVDGIAVVGTFQEALGGDAWDPAGALALAEDGTDPAGTFWTARSARVPAGFYEYSYLVTFGSGETRVVSDPCARYGGSTRQRAGVVIGGSQPADDPVRLLAERRPLQDLNVYELMIDDFTADYRGRRAPLAAVVDRLDYVRDLGFDAVLFMPWTTWRREDFDWGYEPFQYFAVEPRYADDLDEPAEKLSWLRRLVNECHDRGIHVIMDGVFNHVSVDFPYKALYRDEGRCPFTARPFGGAFPGLQDLDFSSDCTRELVRDVCLYWIDTFGIDGIRFDNTVNFYVAGDLRGLPELLDDVQAHLDAAGERNFSMTLEHLDLSAAAVTDATRATSFWDNSLFACCFDGLWNGRVDQRLLNALNNRRFLQSQGKLPTLYLSNHDHSHVTWQAGARTNEGACGGWFKTQPWVIALFTSTATPLVQNGQELGEDHFLPEDDHGTGRRIRSRPLAWKEEQDGIGRALLHLYGTMARMRRDHPALRSPFMYPDSWDEWQTRFNPVGVGVDVERQVAIYHRWATLPDGTVENVVVVLNFSDTPQTVSVPFPVDGRWSDLLGGAFSPTISGNRLDVTVSSNWGFVFRRE